MELDAFRIFSALDIFTEENRLWHQDEKRYVLLYSVVSEPLENELCHLGSVHSVLAY